jgi:parallel beta-helix repeat protein
LRFHGNFIAISSMSQTFYVNASTGNDSADGSQGTPFKTLYHALATAIAGDRIQIAPGTYSSETNGDRFPLRVRGGVIVVGNEGDRGAKVIIQGSGGYSSPTFAIQNTAIVLDDAAELRGVSVTNLATRGTGVWIESTTPIVANCTFANSAREGIFLSGLAAPQIEGCVFEKNSANGIAITRSSKGTIANCIFRQTGFGVAIGDVAAPRLSGNQFDGNRTAVLVSGNAQPILRNNTIANSTDDGLTTISAANPNIGSSKTDPGGNVFRNNGKYDIQNATGIKLVSYGNQLSSSQVKGLVEILDSSTATPTPTSDPQPTVTPDPQPSTTPDPQASVTPDPQPSGTPDPQPSGTPTSFPDVAGHWAAAFIQALGSQDLVGGFEDGTFRPDAPLTRAEFAALLARSFDLPNVQEERRFTDVPVDFWGVGAIAKATRMGFMTGFPDGSFRPDQALTRIQTLVALVNGLGFEGGNQNLLLLYNDRGQIPGYGITQMIAATANRLVVNYPQLTLLRPKETIRRGELAAIFHQALVARGTTSAIASAYIVDPDQNVPLFADIQGHWAAPFITGLASRGLVAGYSNGTFRPDAPMTRAEYASMLVAVLSPEPKREGKTFRDVPSGFWGQAAVDQAYRGEFLSGTSDTTFAPNAPLQKVEVAVSLAGGLDWSANSTASLQILADRDQIPTWATQQVAAALEKSAIVNYPNPLSFQPDKTATRAEVAASLYQALRDRDTTLTAINSVYLPSATIA